jgi:hypothetical protein
MKDLQTEEICVTVDRGRYSSQTPTLETLRRIDTPAKVRTGLGLLAPTPKIKTQDIALLLGTTYTLEGMSLKVALTATFWVRYPPGHHL